MSGLLFGAGASGAIFLPSRVNLTDAGVPVTLRAVTGVWAPNGWLQDVLVRTVTVTVSANVGGTLRVTPILNGRRYDGTAGQPDSRVTFTVPVPAVGERTETRTVVGLSRPVTNDLTGARVGLRGTWVSFLVETLGALDASNGEPNPDWRVESLTMEPVLLGQTQQVTNAGTP